MGWHMGTFISGYGLAVMSALLICWHKKKGKNSFHYLYLSSACIIRGVRSANSPIECKLPFPVFARKDHKDSEIILT